jgi:hypothetical protein
MICATLMRSGIALILAAFGLNRLDDFKAWLAQSAPTFPARKALRFAAKAGVVVLILNEVRGVAVVAATAPVWWPAITGMFHAALRGH